jgi:hypothetical protein
MKIAASTILNLFENPQTVHGEQFTVTLDQEYANTTLVNMKVYVEGITGGRTIATDDIKQFRHEFTLTVRA